MTVWLVGTFHEEEGPVTSSNLLEILERIRPEVIFLEIPTAALDAYLDGTRSNLESVAIRRFADKREVALVPVDLPTPVAAFFRDSRYLFERVERTSPDYRHLMDLHRAHRLASGFAYLNSELCSKLWTDVYEVTRAAVNELDDPRLRELYESWVTAHERRDLAMLRRIGEYSRSKPFETGALLVGAAHRHSMLRTIGQTRTADLPEIRWDLSAFLG